MSSKNKEPAFSISIKDMTTQTYRGTGPGGQHRNKTDSCVRLIHEPSGARAEACEDRSQLVNKREAFKRIAQTVKFRLWVNQQLAGKTPEEWVAEQMNEKYLKVEVRDENGWVEENS